MPAVLHRTEGNLTQPSCPFPWPFWGCLAGGTVGKHCFTSLPLSVLWVRRVWSVASSSWTGAPKPEDLPSVFLSWGGSGVPHVGSGSLWDAVSPHKHMFRGAMQECFLSPDIDECLSLQRGPLCEHEGGFVCDVGRAQLFMDLKAAKVSGSGRG